MRTFDFNDLRDELGLKTIGELEKADPCFFSGVDYLRDWFMLPFSIAPQTGTPLADVANYNHILREYSQDFGSKDWVREYGIAGFPCYTRHLILNPEAPVAVVTNIFEIICATEEFPVVDDGEYLDLLFDAQIRAYDDIVAYYKLEEEMSGEELRALWNYIVDNGFEEYGDWIVNEEKAVFYARYESKTEIA